MSLNQTAAELRRQADLIDAAAKRWPDVLTVAYIASGVRAALTKADEAGASIDLDDFEGEMGFMDACISHAPLLDELWADGRDGDYVFAYEIAEPFGERFAAALLSDRATADARAIAIDLFREANRDD